MSGRQTLARLGTGLGGLALAAGAATTVARLLPGLPGVAPDTWVMATSFTDAGAVAYLLAAAGLGSAALLRRTRGRLLALPVVLVLGAVHLSWVVPAYVADDRPAAGTERLHVLAQNLKLGSADAPAVVRASADVDVLVLTEITADAADALADAGLTTTHPHQAGGPLPAWGSTGTRLYSRFPILTSRALDPRLGDQHWLAVVDVPGLGAITVVGVHPQRPVRGGSGWAQEQEQLRRALPHARTVVAGDFNAVDSHPSLRRLRADGFRDSDDLVGAGWQPTYPAQGRIPPLIAIDHVLVSDDLTATGFQTVTVPGTDHRGVLATLALRG